MFDLEILYKSGSGVSGTEGQDPAGTDPIDLQLPRGATSSGTPQTSTTSVTRLIDTKSLLQLTPYHGDKASFLGWKWSFLIAVRAISKPLYEGLKKIQDNMTRISENPDCPLKIWNFRSGVHTVSVALQR